MQTGRLALVARGEVTIDTGDDHATRQLARVLLAAEIMSQLAAVYMVFEMIEHGALSYQLNWHWQQLKKRWAEERNAERQLRRDIGRVLFEAQRVVEEHRG